MCPAEVLGVAEEEDSRWHPGQRGWLGTQASLCVCGTGRRLGCLTPALLKEAQPSFPINKIFNRFLANWQEKCM